MDKYDLQVRAKLITEADAFKKRQAAMAKNADQYMKDHPSAWTRNARLVRKGGKRSAGVDPYGPGKTELGKFAQAINRIRGEAVNNNYRLSQESIEELSMIIMQLADLDSRVNKRGRMKFKKNESVTESLNNPRSLKRILDEMCNLCQQGMECVGDMEEDLSSVSTPSVEQIAAKHGVPVERIERQLVIGTNIEHEHTTDPMEAREIALDHIAEQPDYYTQLQQMEKRGKERLDKFDSRIHEAKTPNLDPFEKIIVRIAEKLFNETIDPQDAAMDIFDAVNDKKMTESIVSRAGIRHKIEDPMNTVARVMGAYFHPDTVKAIVNCVEGIAEDTMAW